MPIVRMDMWAGQSQKTKKKLAKEMTEVIARNIGAPEQAVTILFNDIPKENWVIGGKPSSEPS